MNEVKGEGVIGCITLDAMYAKCVHSVSPKLRNISSDSTVIYRMILIVDYQESKVRNRKCPGLGYAAKENGRFRDQVIY